MEKRLFLAIALSLFILIIYSSITSHFLPKPQQIQSPKDVTTYPAKSYEQKKELTPTQENLLVSEDVSAKEELLELQNAELSLFLDPQGSGIAEANIRSYDFSLPQTNMGKLVDWSGARFKQNDVTYGKILSYDDKDKGIEVRKTYRFLEDKFILEMVLEFITHSETKSYVKYALNIASINPEVFKKKIKDPAEQRYLEISISLPDKVLRKNFFNSPPPVVNGQIKWIGVRDRYFCSIIKPLQESEGIEKVVKAGTTSYVLKSKTIELLPGETVTHTYKLYIGPQKQQYLAKLDSNSAEIINFGFFDTLSQILLGTLNFLHKISKNWGLTLVLFSLLVFLLVFPLSIKSFSSMKRMQELQPAIEEIKLRHKDNLQKQQKEIMELYRREKVNPLGGCLPMVLQMPIFISLFQLLMRFVDLKGASFLWIKDLSEPDRLYIFSKFPKDFPVVGNELNLLPIIMIITMLIQQKLTGVKHASTDQTAQQQKMMSLFFSIFFGIIFYHMPAGLVLYWTVNSVLMLIFQMKVFKQSATKLWIPSR